MPLLSHIAHICILMVQCTNRATSALLILHELFRIYFLIIFADFPRTVTIGFQLSNFMPLVAALETFNITSASSIWPGPTWDAIWPSGIGIGVALGLFESTWIVNWKVWITVLQTGEIIYFLNIQEMLKNIRAYIFAPTFLQMSLVHYGPYMWCFVGV